MSVKRLSLYERVFAPARLDANCRSHRPQSLTAKSLLAAVTVSVICQPLSSAQTNNDSLPAVVLQPTLLSSPLPLDKPTESSSAQEATLMVSDLRGLLLVDEARLGGAARVAAIGDDFTIAATGDGILVEGPAGEGEKLVTSLAKDREVAIYHPSRRYVAEQGEDTQPAVIELEYVGKAQLLETRAAREAVATDESANSGEQQSGEGLSPPSTARAWLQITESKGVIRQGDLVFAEESLSNDWLDLIHSSDGSSVQLELRPSPPNLAGSVLSLFGGKQWGAQGDSVVVNLGEEHGLEPGMVLSLEYEDVVTSAAEALIYRTTASHAQGLVLSAPSPVRVGSPVRSAPER